jgi:pimeloyl-ACP methyl ester carboxylesterase
MRPEKGMALTARGNPAARDLFRHAMADVGGNANLARSWSRLARALPSGGRREVLDLLPRLDLPVLLLWADEDRLHPLRGAEEALDLLPDGALRVLPGTGFLIAYDDPVGVAREILAFCG